MLIGTQDEPPTRAEAEAFLERWVAGLEPRLAWFEAEVAAEGGPALDHTTASLEPLAELVVERIGSPTPVDPVPIWYREVHQSYGWSPYGAALAEGLMAYVAQIYRNVAGAGADWVLNTDQQHADYHQPVMRDPRIAPSWTQVRGSTAMRQRGRPPGGLRRAVESVLSTWTPSEGDPGADLRVEVVASNHPEFDLQVSLPEDLADTLGEEQFASLEERFAEVPGVVSALFEDRELCLLQTVPGVGADTVRACLQSVVDALATPRAG